MIKISQPTVELKIKIVGFCICASFLMTRHTNVRNAASIMQLFSSSNININCNALKFGFVERQASKLSSSKCLHHVRYAKYSQVVRSSRSKHSSCHRLIVLFHNDDSSVFTDRIVHRYCKVIFKQEGIIVERVPPACADRMCFNSHQMSLGVRFQVRGGGDLGACTVRSKASKVMVTWEPPPHEQNDR